MKKRWAILCLVSVGSFLAACTGSDGEDGARGPDGADGSDGENGERGAQGDPGDAGVLGQDGENGLPGEPGEPGEAGVAPDGGLTTGCLSPCHGFSGIVEQWKTSTHFSTYIANLGGDEVETWTGQKECGNCHAIDGLEQRLAGNVIFSATGSVPAHLADGQLGYKDGSSFKAVSYGGQATVAVVHCSTCHDTSANSDPHRTGEPYEFGSFPLRVPHGEGDQAYIEKSLTAGESEGLPAADYGWGNTCIWCHRSRKDVTNYIKPSGNTLNSYWGPHEGPQSDVYTGLGGYEYAGRSYVKARQTTHVLMADGCVGCHMPKVASNGDVGDHSFYPRLNACQQSGCHAGATDFDPTGTHSSNVSALDELRAELNVRHWLTQDGTSDLTGGQLSARDYELDQLKSASGLTDLEAGAVYNYLLLARGSAEGVHNGVYLRELVYDSLDLGLGVTPSVSRPEAP